MPRRYSHILWMVIAAILVVISYLITVCLAVACLSLILFWSSSIVIALGGLTMGLVILWSLIPRRDRFDAPGILLQRSECPRLFNELDRIAAALNESVPGEVYLVAEVNAWVAERGGLFGIGSRRVIGLGLP